MAKRRRRRADPTDDWEQLELLCAWEEQREYERIRPLVLFGEPIPERAVQTGTSERTLYRRIAGFEEDGMRSLFGSDPAKRRVLPASLRRLIVDLKAEHPTLNLNEIARICYVRTGRKPHLATVRGVLDEEPVPIKAFRRFEPYHEIPEGRERRKAVEQARDATGSAVLLSGSPVVPRGPDLRRSDRASWRQSQAALPPHLLVR